MLLLAGCVTTDRAALHVGIAGISLTDSAGGVSEASFTLQIANEEIYPFVVEKEEHTISVDGVVIGEATGIETFALPQLGVATRVLRLQVASGPAIEALRAAIRRGGGEYRVHSKLTTNFGGDKMAIVNTNSGSFSIP